MNLDKLIPVLQLAIGPVIVISGVGLVLLSMTNRYGRVIDRARMLADSLRKMTNGDTVNLSSQLRVIVHRARLLRTAIAFTSLSLLFAALLIIALFLTTILGLDSAAFIIVLFISCMAALIVGLLVFFVDVNLSLTALDLEIELKHDANTETTTA